MREQSGQIIIILLLIVVVSLSIGLSIIGRSTSEITSSNRVEDSQRAFFAAEAGIERAVSTGVGGNLPLTNNSQADVRIDVGPLSTYGVEYPGLLKKDFAHFWLANPDTTVAGWPSCSTCYSQNSFDVYFGNEDLNTASANKPAIEVNVVTRSASNVYTSNRYYYDSNPTRAVSNGFNAPNPACRQSYQVNTIINTNSPFFCKVSVPPNTSAPCSSTVNKPYSCNGTPILARIRLLYMDGQKVALAPVGGGSLPPQTKVYTSIGKSGNLQRVIRVINESNVVPQLFDYSIFSAADITK